jgi:membrane fusion protein, copper/silver efflux system
MEKHRIKNIGIYLLLIAAGLLLGWLVFGGGREPEGNDHEAHVHETDGAQAEVEYTCSMHPQVRQDEPGNCPICGMELIPASDGDDHQDDDPFLFTMREAYSTWANVRTRKVEAMHAAPTLRLTGRVAVNEREERLITASFPGRVEALYADFTGRFIREGERLMTIYSPELMQAQQELIQAAAGKEDQPRLYEAARSRLKLFNLTEGQIQSIEERRQPSATTDVYASRSGYITRKEVSEGDYVGTGSALLAIAGLQNVWVELDAYEGQIGQFRTGQSVRVHPVGNEGQSVTGQVEFIDPFLDANTRTARVRLTVANPGGALKPGMLVHAVVDGTPQHQLVIPETAVLWTGRRSVVYVKKPQGNGFTFEFREIETGARTNEGIAVLSGLTEGEEIAVNGVFAIDAAAQLRGHYSMMSPPERGVIPEPFRGNLARLFKAYFDLKNALAGDDPEMARDHGQKLSEQLESTGKHSLDGEYHMFWMDRYEDMEESLEKFMAASGLEEIRKHFEPLSEAFIETARTLGAIGQTWYVAYCPMVDGDRGAYWLSEFEQISNPYFGSMMLRCGEVRQTLRESTPVAGREEVRPAQVHQH